MLAGSFPALGPDTPGSAGPVEKPEGRGAIVPGGTGSHLGRGGGRFAGVRQSQLWQVCGPVCVSERASCGAFALPDQVSPR